MIPSNTDSLGYAIDWAPLDPNGGARFRTHTLHRAGLSYEWQKRGTAKFPALGMLVLGLLLLVAFFPAAPHLAPWVLALLVGVGVAFAAGGLYFFQRLTRPVTFDREVELFHHAPRVRPIAFDEIAAVQFLSHFVEQAGSREEQGRDKGYELNVVQKDGTRTRIVGHGDRDTLRREGGDLAKFLGVDFWESADDQSA